MNIVKLLFELFIIYLLYKLVFELIIPLFNATRQMKHKMADMQEHMREQQDRRQALESGSHETAKSGDYIDYEEVK